MARESYRIVVCGSCGQKFDESPLGSGFTGQPRPPCPNCGSMAREYRLGLAGGITPTGDHLMVTPKSIVHERAIGEPRIETTIDQGVASGEFTRTVVWSKTPNAWLAEVRDASGSLVALEINFDAMDTLVLLAEHLLPPGE